MKSSHVPGETCAPASTPAAPPAWFAAMLEAVLGHRDLTAMQTCTFMQAIFDGQLAEPETAALLVALRMKGESAEELAAAAAVLRERSIYLDTGRDDLLDTCGTGGDATWTFNISTAAALVVAGAGVPVVKHGNRAVSSKCGSADVLRELGVTIDCEPETTRRCLEHAGIAFCLAPVFHPGLARVSSLRRRLGVRTLFNCLGPLANPARAPYQLLGVGRLEWLDRMAGALARLGTRRAVLVCGCDGLDEVTLSGPTLVRQVGQGQVRTLEWRPEDFGLEPCNLDALRAEGPVASAGIIREVLGGDGGPAGRVVWANAAAALLTAGRAASLKAGVDQARLAIQSGRASRALEALIEVSSSAARQT